MAETLPPGAKKSPWLLKALAVERPVCSRDPGFDSNPEFDRDPESEIDHALSWLTSPCSFL
jgi:hypothetical protein